MKKQLCVFDLDGTLLDTIGDLCAAGNHALKTFDMPTYSLDQYRTMVGNGMARLVERMTGLPRSSKQYFSVFEEFMQYYQMHHADHTVAYDGIANALSELRQRKVRLAVLSNKSEEFVVLLIKRYFADIDFDLLQGQNIHFPVKPDPSSLNDMVARLSVPKESTIYIGDSDVDVQTAHNAGMQCIGAVWGFRGEDELKNAGADHLAYHPSDILRFV